MIPGGVLVKEWNITLSSPTSSLYDHCLCDKSADSTDCLRFHALHEVTYDLYNNEGRQGERMVKKTHIWLMSCGPSSTGEYSRINEYLAHTMSASIVLESFPFFCACSVMEVLGGLGEVQGKEPL